MFSLLIAASLVFGPEDAEFAERTTREFIEECTPRDAGTIRGGIAANWILDRASMTGADVRRDVFRASTPNGMRRFVNLYGEFESNPSSRWVVIVSHYDTKPGTNCPGANDGGSTTGLLISLANVISEWREQHGNVMLVWTDGEECMGERYSPGDGFQGAERAVQYLKEKDRKVQAVVCLDMLGDADPAISVPANGDPTLAKIAQHAARRIGEPNLVTPMADSVKDDHVAFSEAGHRAIVLIDFSYGPGNAWWHTAEDTCDKLSKESFLKSGRLVCEMLRILM